MQDDLEGIGGRLRRRRIEMRLTQHDLAMTADVQVGQIARYETGRRTPNAESLARLARGLGVSVDWILGLDASQEPQNASGAANSPQGTPGSGGG